MMCIGWKNTDTCSGGIDQCSVVAIEGGAVITDPTRSACNPQSSPWGWLLAIGAGLLLVKGNK